MFESVALAALALDASIGWPARLYGCIGHPVGFFARIIETCESHWNKPHYPRRTLGTLTVVLLILASAGTGYAVEYLVRQWLGAWSWVAIALLSFPGLAQRSLFDHVRPVAMALRNHDLPHAREAVGMIVGRDTSELDEAGVARADIESLAESFCDGVAAPLFWLLVLGLPGIWAYKAINTADSLIGHKEDRWRQFGWAAARTDDLVNLAPARIGGVVICLANALTHSRSIGVALRTMVRDAGKHASPNAGWTEAAMAGALHLRLAGPISYDGIVHDKPWIGDGRTDASAHDVGRALTVYIQSCLILWALAGVCAWAL